MHEFILKMTRRSISTSKRLLVLNPTKRASWHSRFPLFIFTGYLDEIELFQLTFLLKHTQDTSEYRVVM